MPIRVLVVDDSDTTRRIVRMLIGSRNWDVCGEADGGCSAVEKFRRLKPDVVVLDLAMPDLNGIETAKRMSAFDPEVPIILFTILEVEGIERFAQEAGISAVVPKREAWNLLGSIETLVQQPNP
jgi:chemotaxis response regulator CheB